MTGPAAACARGPARSWDRSFKVRAVPDVPVFEYDAVLAAISAEEAVERVRDGFIRYTRGEWEMPPKVYVDAPPRGDFRAMPARGGGLAILKWATSFTGNPEHGLPVVQGAILVSSGAGGNGPADFRLVCAGRGARKRGPAPLDLRIARR
jgi:hypothetical protein